MTIVQWSAFMPHPHGTINRYNNQRCRCELCRAAIRDYRRTQRARRQVKTPNPLPRPTTGTPVAATLPSSAKRVSDPDGATALRFQIAQASCGHLLWFANDVKVPLGGWVRCPQHPLTGVREVHRTASIPKDAFPGSAFAPPSGGDRSPFGQVRADGARGSEPASALSTGD